MVFKKCFSLAVNNLRKCYGEDGIRAGLHQFNDYWSRDSMWASLGALIIGDYEIVRKNLETFIKAEKKGLIPLRIGNKFFIQTFMGLKSKKLHPNYYEHKSKTIATDSNTLLVIALYYYIRTTKDNDFFKKHHERIRRILQRVQEMTDDDSLIIEDYYSTWMDAIKKRGKTFYSNLLFYLAVKYYLELIRDNGINSERFSKKLLETIRNNIKKTFWNGTYFKDWVGNNDKDYFDTFANLIAVYFDFATNDEKETILDFIKKNNIIRNDGTILKSYPDYKSNYISLLLKLIGMKGYASAITYLWMSLFYFLSLKKEKKLMKEDILKMRRLCSLIIKDKTIHECYSFQLKPFKTLIYSSEHPFAWASSFAVLLLHDYDI